MEIICLEGFYVVFLGLGVGNNNKSSPNKNYDVLFFCVLKSTTPEVRIGEYCWQKRPGQETMLWVSA